MTYSRFPAYGMLAAAAIQFFCVAVYVILISAGIAGAGSFGLIIAGAVQGLVGVVLVFAGLAMLRKRGEALRIRDEGVPGSAEVLAVQQTGVEMNNQPGVRIHARVTTPVHGTYETTIKGYLPLIAIGRVGNGVPLSVMVDREDRDKVIIDWSAAAPRTGSQADMLEAARLQAYAQSTAMPPQQRDLEKQRLLQTGLPGEARILSVSATGQLDPEGRPVYDLMLHISMPGRPPASGPARVGIPLEHIGRMQVGGVIPMRIDPYDPSKMAADWERQPAI